MAKHQRPARILLYLGLAFLALAAWALTPGKSHAPKLGLDLQGGTQVILSPQTAVGTDLNSDQIAQTVAIIRQRVDGFGVAESEVTTQGSGNNTKIIVTIPGSTDRAVVDQLKTTAKLSFRPVLAIDYGSPQPQASSTPSASAEPAASASASATAAPSPTPTPSASVPADQLVPPIQAAAADDSFVQRFQALDCATSTIAEGSADDETQYLVTCDKDNAYKYALAPALLSGTDVESATAGLPQQGAGGWQVDLTLTTGGASKFADATKSLSAQESPNDQFAIILDGIVMSAPQVNEPILGGSATISGSFTAEEAKALSQVLKFGALPVSLNVDEVQQISPTLGNDQLRAGVLAGVFGLILTAIYLLLYYRALGVIAVISLGVAAIISYLIFVVLGREIKFTLTLAGIAGAIVAIGITADSFVVYFERIRDELREGKRLKSAVDHGWDRARRTILAADFVSLLAAIVLYYLSVGSVRGFAFTLGLTTAIDIVVAFYFTRPLVGLVARGKLMNSNSKWSGVDMSRIAGIAPTEVDA